MTNQITSIPEKLREMAGRCHEHATRVFQGTHDQWNSDELFEMRRELAEIAAQLEAVEAAKNERLIDPVPTAYQKDMRA